MSNFRPGYGRRQADCLVREFEGVGEAPQYVDVGGPCTPPLFTTPVLD